MRAPLSRAGERLVQGGAGVLGSPLKASLLVTLWLGLESFVLGPFSHILLNEFGDGVYPYFKALASGALGPGSHYWFPNVAAGVDRLANSLLYPQAVPLLAWVLPGWAAYQVFLFIHFFFCCYFTARLCTDHLKTSAPAGILAGFAVACGTPFTGGIGNSVFPFVLWAFDKLLDEDRGRGLLGAALLGLFFSVFASAVVSMPFCFAWALLWLGLVRKRLSLRAWVLGAVMGIFASAPHLQEVWSMAVHAKGSHRAGWGALLTCSSPDFLKGLGQGFAWAWGYCGVSVTVAVLGLLACRLRVKGFAWVYGLLLFTIAAAGTGEWFKTCAGLASGTLGGLRMHRFFLILPLAAGLAGAAGLELLAGRRWIFLLATAVLFGQSAYSKKKVLWEFAFQGGYTANFESPVLRELAAKRRPQDPFRVVTFTHGLLPGYAAAYGLESLDGYINLYPRAYFRFWGKVIEPVIKREPYLEEYFGKWGGQVYLFLRSVDDWPGGVVFSQHYRLPLLSLANMRYVISKHPLEDPAFKLLTPQKPWKDMSRREHVWTRVKENFTGKTYLFIYENTAAFPRAFLAPRLRELPDEDSLWDALAAASPAELKDAVYVERSRSPGKLPGRPFSRGRVELDLYRTDELLLSVEADGPGFLVVSNSLDSCWVCRVDGKERPLFPAYGAFWGVVLEKGDRKVEFNYAPPYRLAAPE
ncbi:MAG: hypothetical protein HY924_17280 [Elusimicrobia bacterium]|nr:hypothetical protein [Elusimicrobiota bacterium]